MGGAGGSEMLKEYKDMEERDRFLLRETEDLKKSAESLSTLIKELKEKLDVQFDEGIDKINKQFSNFFSLMFGGGSASITVFEEKKKARVFDPEALDEEQYAMEEEETEPERGIDIKVNLPQKKIRDLAMLSGGERALTSIALLFAISQVNPPPFLVLDETDAALDEANSRKYGDMLENLSKFSQLIVITHNRETMSRAGVIYGVTTGSDSVSKLLSIKFEEAVEIAK
jgi:chromosome segregation protein